MSEKSKPETTLTAEPETPAVPVPQPAPPVTPSPTVYGELATSLIANLDDFSARVPGFDDESVTPEFVRRKQRIPVEFVSRAIGALFGNSELTVIHVLDAAETMDDKQYVDAMLPVEQKLFTVYKRLRFTIQVRQARLARRAQQIYGVAKEIARDRETSTIRAQVAAMAKARPRRRSKPEEPTTTPAAGKEGNDTSTTTVKKQ